MSADRESHVLDRIHEHAARHQDELDRARARVQAPEPEAIVSPLRSYGYRLLFCAVVAVLTYATGALMLVTP